MLVTKQPWNHLTIVWTQNMGHFPKKLQAMPEKVLLSFTFGIMLKTILYT